VGLLTVPQKRDDFAGDPRLLLQRQLQQDRLPIWKRYGLPFIAGKALAHGCTRSEFFAGASATEIPLTRRQPPLVFNILHRPPPPLQLRPMQALSSGE
jgi:hypothetical protein